MRNKRAHFGGAAAKLAAAPFFLLILIGCSDPAKVTEKHAQSSEAAPDQVVQTFVNDRCLMCHTEASVKNRFISLVDIGSVIEKPGHDHTPGSPRRIIKPGCPKQSLFLSMMRAGKMPPPPAEKVSVEMLDKINAFIIALNPEAAANCTSDEPPDDDGPTDEPGER